MKTHQAQLRTTIKPLSSLPSCKLRSVKTNAEDDLQNPKGFGIGVGRIICTEMASQISMVGGPPHPLSRQPSTTNPIPVNGFAANARRPMHADLAHHDQGELTMPTPGDKKKGTHQVKDTA